MNKKQTIYFLITFIFIFISLTIIRKTNIQDSVELSKAISIIIIMYLIRVSYGCTLYIREKYQKQKYSYTIVMNLALLIFIIINIARQINLLIYNWNILSISTIYNHTLESFSYFAMLTLPCIIILSLYSILTNIVLIKKEGFKISNLLGIFLGILSLLGLVGSQTIYKITAQTLINREDLIIKKLIDIILNLVLSYFYSLIIATLYCNIKAGNHTPKYDKDFVIILGAKIKEDGTLTPLLKSRVDKAISFGEKQYTNTKKKIIYIPSGGQGEDENISEAEAVREYLLKKGIDKNQIIIENKSKNTNENMKFSKIKIDEVKKDAKISFSTTNYHVFRSGIIANNEGIECEGMGSKTKWYFYTNALIREFIANIVQERKRHIGVIIIMVIITYILIWIGYYYNFIYIS